MFKLLPVLFSKLSVFQLDATIQHLFFDLREGELLRVNVGVLLVQERNLKLEASNLTFLAEVWD